MNSKQTPTRVFGQYSITSSFLSRFSNSFKESKEELGKKDSKKLTSLSDFLNRKLPRSSGISKTVQEKSKPFSSLLRPKEWESVDKQNESKKEIEKMENDVVDKVVLEQFKQDNIEKVDFLTSPGRIAEEEEVETLDSTNEVQNSRKRQNPFQGSVEERRTRRPFLVLGHDSEKPKTERRKCSISNKKRNPHYNHYANGCGWWDCDMEGVDSEEVGLSEVWEGVGSTTFGGIVDWH